MRPVLAAVRAPGVKPSPVAKPRRLGWPVTSPEAATPPAVLASRRSQATQWPRQAAALGRGQAW
jgi:hypothetical protein